jgi:hypothetical protein
MTGKELELDSIKNLYKMIEQKTAEYAIAYKQFDIGQIVELKSGSTAIVESIQFCPENLDIIYMQYPAKEINSEGVLCWSKPFQRFTFDEVKEIIREDKYGNV